MSGVRVLIVGSGELARDVQDEIDAVIDEQTRVTTVPDVESARTNLPTDLPVALVCLIPPPGPADSAVRELSELPAVKGARVLLITSAGEHDDVSQAVDAGHVDAFVAAPMTRGFLGQHARSQIARWMRLHRPDAAAHDGPDTPRSELLRDMEASAHVVEGELVAAIERALGPRPRLHLPAGVRLTRQGKSVDGVFVILSGRVALTRHTAAEDLLLHHASTGPVVGLLSLSRSQRAFFTSTTTTDVVVIHLSIEQLDRALALDPEVGAALAAVAIRGLAVRLQRSEQLQVERNTLNIALKKERSELAKALAELEAARLELVAQARFATLGELAAGIAHELNNPVAALTRSAEHLQRDLAALLGPMPEGEDLLATVHAARTRAPRSTAQERALRRELEAITDRATAWRLVTAGVPDVQTGQRVLAAGTVDRFEQAAGIGTQLRAIAVSAARISTLVTSLRSYARPDDERVDGVDVATTVEDTLHLVSHRLRHVRLERDYTPVPEITCHPSQLGQVWTNVLVNAGEALTETPDARITIVIDAPERGQVRVRIIDNGPGIPPDLIERVFQPHFTTKHGTVRFGLGMGLGLAAHIVADHHGSIDIESEPGRTCVLVTLPTDTR
ncbi:MAG: ATP-binding protein [Bowdeniella nasicola]|nr:ATP-binding protein [Bowdeniella nasicola]